MAEEVNNEKEPNEKPKASKKLLIIGLLAGLVVGGGVAAGFFIMQSGSAEAELVPSVQEVKPQLPDYQYARMEALQLPLFYNGKVLNYAVIDVSLEVIGNDDKLLVVRNNVLVRDALLRHFSVNSVGRDDNPNIVDYDKLSEKIKEFSNAGAKREIVKRVAINYSRSY